MKDKPAFQTVFVSTFTDGVLDPGKPMLGPLIDGGFIVANTAPGCWGPMITPEIKGGHEVTQPVYIEGAEVGDAVAISILSIKVTSKATASGNETIIDGRFLGDPYVAAKCPNCDILYPKSVVSGIGEGAVRCEKCGEPVSPFAFTHGYTMAFDEKAKIGVTVDSFMAKCFAENAKMYAAMPECSVQNSILSIAPADMVGVVSRMRPFLGQLGTTPAIAMPDSHNAGDFGSFLVGAPHEYGLKQEDLEARTDGHMDISRVREGAVLICPVKVPGAGIYMGDAHAMQGDGEIAGHTCDVSALVILKVSLLKSVNIEGPILLPLVEDLPYLAKLMTADEEKAAYEMARSNGIENFEVSAPVSVVGTGVNLNAAIDNGLSRAAALFEMSVPEVKNRATITGGIEIGRCPGVVTVTFLVPVYKLKKPGLYETVCEHYGKRKATGTEPVAFCC